MTHRSMTPEAARDAARLAADSAALWLEAAEQRTAQGQHAEAQADMRQAREEASRAGRAAIAAQQGARRRDAQPAAPRQAVADGWAAAADAADHASNAAADAGWDLQAATWAQRAEDLRNASAENDTGSNA